MAKEIDLVELTRDHLIALEESIINLIIERAQYKTNSIIYQPGKSNFKGEDKKSLFQIRLEKQESLDAEFGRFKVPEERPFTNNLPKEKREVKKVGISKELKIKDYNQINLTNEIMANYLNLILEICKSGDDGQYGSSVESDVSCIRKISERIHFGAFYVAEGKYQKDKKAYTELIKRKDSDKIKEKLRDIEVEKIIISRIKSKVEDLQKNVDGSKRHKVNALLVAKFYEKTIIPLTIKGEVLYLMNRKA